MSLQIVEEIFLRAIELSHDERLDFLDRETSDQPELRDEVEVLIAKHVENNSDSNFILDRPANQIASSKTLPLGENVGDQIGPYRLLEKIGEGGMGTVYMAEQTRGVQRKVALKIIKLGMDTRQVVARFEAERQAMALFDHPGIARVFDAGSTDNGRPYFVMELVRGQDLISFSKSHKLDLQSKLKLFVATCQAVQHAHQKGIIHRDLKPSNIMVTLFDGVPVPKVIDFGIAKAIGHKLTDKTLFTRYSSMIGTPQYMSPEQAELSGHDVDTRSDIYSLGVLLYELITGTTPLDAKQLSTLNPMALYETLRDATIETPSSQISKSNFGESAPRYEIVADRRLKNELDWVVMKALARERGQRYATANELATDIQRFLDGDPVAAVPPSRWYRMRSWISKNRNTALAITLVSVLIFSWALTSSILAVNAHTLNRRLTAAFAEQEASLTRAEKAESELRAANERQLYRSAYSQTASKFMSQYCLLHQAAFREVFEQRFRVAAEMDRSLKQPEKYVAIMERAYSRTCCFPAFRDFIEFPKLEAICELPVKLLKEQIKRMEENDEEIGQFVENSELMDLPGMQPLAYKLSLDPVTAKTLGVSELAEENSEGSANQDQGNANAAQGHSEICILTQRLLDKDCAEHRVLFYRILVNQYRLEFGDDDVRVSDALTLLAASLAEIGRNSEAEPHLREAIALLSPEDSITQRKLLEEILKAN